MITELEEQFFKVFGVEKKCQCKNFINYADCFRIPTECKEYSYPEITDRKLLEMICIMNKHIHKNNENALCPIAGESREEIKNYMLRLLNFNQPLLEKNFIKEIQQLFKEEQ